MKAKLKVKFNIHTLDYLPRHEGLWRRESLSAAVLTIGVGKQLVSSFVLLIRDKMPRYPKGMRFVLLIRARCPGIQRV